MDIRLQDIVAILMVVPVEVLVLFVVVVVMVIVFKIHLTVLMAAVRGIVRLVVVRRGMVANTHALIAAMAAAIVTRSVRAIIVVRRVTAVVVAAPVKSVLPATPDAARQKIAAGTVPMLIMAIRQHQRF